MKEWATYIITLQYEEIWKDRPYSRITQEEFTWKENKLFDYIKSKIEKWQSEWKIVDIISIIQDFIH